MYAANGVVKYSLWFDDDLYIDSVTNEVVDQVCSRVINVIFDIAPFNRTDWNFGTELMYYKVLTVTAVVNYPNFVEDKQCSVDTADVYTFVSNSE